MEYVSGGLGPICSRRWQAAAVDVPPRVCLRTSASWPARVQALHTGEGLSLSSIAPNARHRLLSTGVRMRTSTIYAPTSAVNSGSRQHISFICAIIHIYWTTLLVLETFKWSSSLVLMLLTDCSRLVGS
ncbi:hypothetical protein PVAP13_5NG208424 [Panicum virgatum]|uniref:Uncharacterized protein n=1 Tax=Panicum virgatum TaxID=38727 RepID=A0A8T0RTY0_PANVG|nr:hypothetical protein PVAP13_5NG208424 [Panicum virgatum]